MNITIKAQPPAYSFVQSGQSFSVRCLNSMRINKLKAHLTHIRLASFLWD